VSTTAQVQAETLDQDVKRLVISDWFATEWLMVAENDRDSYEQLKSEAEHSDGIAQLSDSLRNEWEMLAEKVTDLTAEHISPSAALFISQILQGWGSLPFDIIAKQVKDRELESRVYDWLSSSLKTGEK
jgi:hypothetical protein